MPAVEVQAAQTTVIRSATCTLEWCLNLQVPEARCILGLCIDSSHAANQDSFIRAVAGVCLERKFEAAPDQSGYKLSPVLLCQVGTAVRMKCPDLPGKLLDHVREPSYRNFFKLVPGPSEVAVLVDLPKLIAQPHPPEVVNILTKTRLLELHPHLDTRLKG